MKTKFNTTKRFLLGIGSVLNIFPVYHVDASVSKALSSSDKQTLQSDWQQIGSDFDLAIKKLK